MYTKQRYHSTLGSPNTTAMLWWRNRNFARPSPARYPFRYLRRLPFIIPGRGFEEPKQRKKRTRSPPSLRLPSGALHERTARCNDKPPPISMCRKNKRRPPLRIKESPVRKVECSFSSWTPSFPVMYTLLRATVPHKIKRNSKRSSSIESVGIRRKRVQKKS